MHCISEPDGHSWPTVRPTRLSGLRGATVESVVRSEGAESWEGSLYIYIKLYYFTLFFMCHALKFENFTLLRGVVTFFYEQKKIWATQEEFVFWLIPNIKKTLNSVNSEGGVFGVGGTKALVRISVRNGLKNNNKDGNSRGGNSRSYSQNKRTPRNNDKKSGSSSSHSSSRAICVWMKKR